MTSISDVMNHRVVNPFLANCYQHERFLPYSSSVFNINFQGQQREIALVPWVSLVASLIKTALTALSHFADWGNRHTHIHKHIYTHPLLFTAVCSNEGEKMGQSKWNREQAGVICSVTFWEDCVCICSLQEVWRSDLCSLKGINICLLH